MALYDEGALRIVKSSLHVMHDWTELPSPNVTRRVTSIMKVFSSLENLTIHKLDVRSWLVGMCIQSMRELKIILMDLPMSIKI